MSDFETTSASEGATTAPKNNKRRKRAIIAIGVGAVVVAAGAGTAFAYWTTSGSGTGTAAVGTSSAITVNQTSTVAGLYPGGPAVSLAGNFTNGASGKQFVGQVSVAVQSGWTSRTDSTKPACTSADFTLVQPTATNAEVPSGTNVGAWSGASISMIDSATNQDNCKTVSVPLVYTSN
jgi:hypothetical protein